MSMAPRCYHRGRYVEGGRCRRCEVINSIKDEHTLGLVVGYRMALTLMDDGRPLPEVRAHLLLCLGVIEQRALDAQAGGRGAV